MTILPKKKTSQQKSETEKPTDGAPYSSDSHGAADGRDRFSYPSRTSPPAWPGGGRQLSHNSSREEKRPAMSTNTGFDDFSDSGPSHSKRRHQTSPHRSIRKTRTHSGHSHRSSSSVYPIAGSSKMPDVMMAGSPQPGCSSVEGGDHSGYNSGDEYERSYNSVNGDELREKERTFEEKLRKKGYCIKKMAEDGACMFRAVADQIYGDQEMHASVRKLCMDYMAKNSDYYSQYVTEDFNKYVERKRSDHIHGNHIEMQAMSEMFNRHIEIYHYDLEPINIFHGSQKTDNEPIRLSYHGNVHYNSIVDPYKATIGVGLGLPAFKPDLANKSMLSEALVASESMQLDQAMLEDKLKATDWEATNEAIEEQVARESYVEWLRDNELRHRSKSRPSATATSCSSLMDNYSDGLSPNSRHHTRSRCSTSTSPKEGHSTSDRDSKSPHAGTSYGSELSYKYDRYGDGSSATSAYGHYEAGAPSSYCGELPYGQYDEEDGPTTSSGKSGFTVVETASFLNQLPPSVFGLSEWEDSGILAKVLAESQQEYIDSFKHNVSGGSS